MLSGCLFGVKRVILRIALGERGETVILLLHIGRVAACHGGQALFAAGFVDGKHAGFYPIGDDLHLALRIHADEAVQVKFGARFA